MTNLAFVLLQHFWDWSWQELALYDLAEMINYINSVTNSKLFVVGHSQVFMLPVNHPFHILPAFSIAYILETSYPSQGTIISFAAFTQPDIVEKVEAAALLSPISYLDHISAPLVLRMEKMHIDQVFVVALQFLFSLTVKVDM